MKTIEIALAMLLAGAVSAAPSHAQPKSFHIGVGEPPTATGKLRAAASAPGGSLAVTRGMTIINADGTMQVTLIYTNAGGIEIHRRVLFIDAGCTRVTDNLSNVVIASGPTAICDEATILTNREDTAIGNASAGGKLNL